MLKFKAKNLALAVFLTPFLVGIIGIVNGQETMPTGGESFEAAVEIEPRSYQGVGLDKDKPEYFYINLKPGQEFKMEGKFEAFPDEWGEETLGLYNEDRAKLVEVSETLDEGEEALFSFSWLPNADENLYKYYIKRECTWHKIELLSLDISLTNYYDAGSQTDAGDAFEKAMSISQGEYKGYLSGKSGSDTKDFYKLTVKKGETLTVKVTPPSEARIEVAVYDSNRQVLKDEYASNPGAIVTNSVGMTKTDDVLVAVICEDWCSENVIDYTLNVSIEPSVEDGEVIDRGEEPRGENGEVEGITKAFGKGIMRIILLWIVIPIVCLIIIGVVIYLLLKKKK